MEKFNPFRFAGRLGRRAYFGYSFLWLAITYGVAILVAFASSPGEEITPGGTAVMLMVSLVYSVATVSYGVRRLHDFNQSGWWYLLFFVPLVNFGMGLILLFAGPSEGENRYGLR
ncbi:MAG: DUF805 domain-containing protein [Trueperaceae bacterium]|nr:MAG: DUF805 domain-containing protein [Trueperaceae bacterium]